MHLVSISSDFLFVLQRLNYMPASRENVIFDNVMVESPVVLHTDK